MSDGFYMIFNGGKGGASPTKQHRTEGEATTEARRLARAQPGDEFFVLRAIKRIVAIDVQEEKLDEPLNF